MSLHSQMAIYCFATLHPDGLLTETFENRPTTVDLTESFTGPRPYVTLPLAEGLELHYQVGNAHDLPNPVASALAVLCDDGGRINIHGPVVLTGESGETDTAPGVTGPALAALFVLLAAASMLADHTRVWRKIPGHHLVRVEPEDYTPEQRAESPLLASEIRADLAPAGYWQRTKNQLIPAR
ncbi:hypothetical protein [Streptomyces sp. NPDC017940]|uniref:hypothetical protein n=1 Tax=Streptomyces sp. NPDC017940 TaxID=3365017 RepID=UPI0037BDDB49